MIELTAFNSIFDNKTNKKYEFESWEMFRKALIAMSKKPGYKPKRGERTKKGSPLISPALFKPKKTRANDNVTYWSRWAALDIDEYEGSMEDVLQQFSDYSFICYSSASSTRKHPKFRVILELSDIVPHDKIRHFWFAVNTEFSGCNDPQTKDLSRMYYVPANYPNAFNFIFHNCGNGAMTPDAVMQKHPYVEPNKDLLSRIPPKMQKAIIQKRKDALTNTDITWSSFRNCPFINKKLLNEFERIAYQDGTGRYSMFYKLMVNIAGNAIRKKYPITPHEIANIMREIDANFGGRYKKRPLEVEAARALEFVLRNNASL